MGIARAIITVLTAIFLVSSGMVFANKHDAEAFKLVVVSLSTLLGVGLGILWSGGF